MIKPTVDFSLNVIIDQDWIRGRDLVALTESVLVGGATLLQYRNKTGSAKQFYNNARLIHIETKRFHVPLIINDRIDIALCIDAEGVHLGQDDIPATSARQVLGPDKIIGLSVSRPDEIVRIQNADYLGVGAMYRTETKDDAEFGGIRLMKQIRKLCQLPLIGIGGITKSNAAQVIRAGADGIAVISAILGSPDPDKAVRELLDIVQEEKKKRFK
jgi:thiamine-phosphate pyrophosphorylase